MGQGIAQVAAVAGFPTRIVDAVPGKADAARGLVASQLEKLVGRGKTTAAARDRALSALSVCASVAEAAAGAAIVIEAAPESMDLKVGLLREAIAAAAPDAVIGSNTSSLSITELGTRSGAPERTVGLHFFNPPPVM